MCLSKVNAIFTKTDDRIIIGYKVFEIPIPYKNSEIFVEYTTGPMAKKVKSFFDSYIYPTNEWIKDCNEEKTDQDGKKYSIKLKALDGKRYPIGFHVIPEYSEALQYFEYEKPFISESHISLLLKVKLRSLIAVGVENGMVVSVGREMFIFPEIIESS